MSNRTLPLPSQRSPLPLSEDAQWLSLLHEISQDFNSTLDMDSLLEDIAQQVRRLVDYKIFNLYLWDEAEEVLFNQFSLRFGSRWEPRLRIRANEGVCGAVVATRQSLRIPDVRKDDRFLNCDPDAGVRSELAVPLLAKGRLVGLINLESTEVGAFSKCHQRMLETLANPIAVSLENARLVERLRRQEASLTEDLKMAWQVQKALLPSHSPLLEGVQIGRAYRPARQLGGDFYDFLNCGPGMLTVAVGDVSGKSTPAALFGSLAIGVLRAQLVHSPCSPSHLLKHMNSHLLQPELDNRFLAMTIGHLDSRTRTLTLSGSGLPHPLLVRDGKVEAIAVEGLPLGLFPDVEYEETDIDLRPGDIVVICSDGLHEAMDGDEAQFGDRGLSDRLARLASRDAQDIADALIEASLRHSGGDTPHEDDRTAVVIKVSKAGA